jgi:hypothetical protein
VERHVAPGAGLGDEAGSGVVNCVAGYVRARAVVDRAGAASAVGDP